MVSEECFEEMLECVCVCVGVMSVFVVVDGCEVLKLLMDVMSRVGMASIAVESLESTALFECVVDGFIVIVEEFLMLVWVEVLMSEC